MDLAAHVIATSTDRFVGLKSLADGAIAQLDGKQLHAVPHADGNSVVVLMKHLAGHMRSRWTDFLTTDGEKADRDRDSEFVDDLESREQLEALWEGGWQRLFDALGALAAEDIGTSVFIRGEPHSVLEALQRQIAHYGYPIGQIVQLARSFQGTAWRALSIPRGESEAYNAALGQRP